MLFSEQNYKFMFSALQEAEKALAVKEVPIGAVVVYKNKIIGKGFNQTEQLKDSTAHAEMIALTAASNYLQAKFLDDCDLYVTVEPCVMCTGAIILTRIKNIYFGTLESKFGACGSLYNIIENKKNHHHPKIFSGIYAEESKSLLEIFFNQKRSLSK